MDVYVHVNIASATTPGKSLCRAPVRAGRDGWAGARLVSDGAGRDDLPVEDRHTRPAQHQDQESPGKDAADMRAPGNVAVRCDRQHEELLPDPQKQRHEGRQGQRHTENTSTQTRTRGCSMT